MEQEQKIDYKYGKTNDIVFGIFSKLETLVQDNNISENEFLNISNGLKRIRDNDIQLQSQRQIQQYNQSQRQQEPQQSSYELIMNDIRNKKEFNKTECDYCGTTLSKNCDFKRHHKTKKCLDSRMFKSRDKNIEIKPLIRACSVYNISKDFKIHYHRPTLIFFSNELDNICLKHIQEQERIKKQYKYDDRIYNEYDKIMKRVDKYDRNFIFKNKLIKSSSCVKYLWKISKERTSPAMEKLVQDYNNYYCVFGCFSPRDFVEKFSKVIKTHLSKVKMLMKNIKKNK